jgi:hypothetical protein
MLGPCQPEKGSSIPLVAEVEGWRDFLNGGYKVHGVKRGVSLGQVDKGVWMSEKKKKVRKGWG